MSAFMFWLFSLIQVPIWTYPCLYVKGRILWGLRSCFLVGTSLPVGLGNLELRGGRQVAPFISMILARYWSLTKRLFLCLWKEKIRSDDLSGYQHLTMTVRMWLNFNPYRVSNWWWRPQVAAWTHGWMPHCPFGRTRGRAAEVGTKPRTLSLAFPCLDIIVEIKDMSVQAICIIESGPLTLLCPLKGPMCWPL